MNATQRRIETPRKPRLAAAGDEGKEGLSKADELEEREANAAVTVK